jgi:hypothetical protein
VLRVVGCGGINPTESSPSVFSYVLFALALIAQEIPNLLLDPCQR